MIDVRTMSQLLGVMEKEKGKLALEHLSIRKELLVVLNEQGRVQR